jgi:hypothetical protein
VCDSLRVELDTDTEEDALGNSFVHQMMVLGGLVHEKIQGALHHGVKRAMVVVQSGFESNMGLIADGFTLDPSKTEEENEVAYPGLIEAVEEPGVDSQGCLRTRCSFLLTMRVCEPNLGMEAHVTS